MGLPARKLVKLDDLLFVYSVCDLLEQWGRWGCSGVGTGSLSTPTYENAHWVSDDVALWIDRAVAQLGVCDDRRKCTGVKLVGRKQALFLFYRERYNIAMVANALKVGETKAAVVLKSAEAWVEGFLTHPVMAVVE
jgi:hypothetical protein